MSSLCSRHHVFWNLVSGDRSTIVQAKNSTTQCADRLVSCNWQSQLILGCMRARGCRACFCRLRRDCRRQTSLGNDFDSFFPPLLLCFDANARLNFGCLECKEEEPIGSQMHVYIGLLGFESGGFWMGK